MFYLKNHRLIVRNVTSQKNQVYITFDDGPSPELTPLILEILHQECVTASFFVIGNDAKKSRPLIQQMMDQGHSIFSHSSDHSYRHYFQASKAVKSWMEDSLSELSDLLGKPVRGFRPPAGILTPPLVKAAEELNVPLILWNQRFFDTRHRLTESNLQRSIDVSRPGDIILLHDRQKEVFQKNFLLNLKNYIKKLKNRNFSVAHLHERQLDHVLKPQ